MRFPLLGRKNSRRGRGFASSAGWLKPETKRAIMGALLGLLAIIAFLSFFHAAGPTGEALFAALQIVFGRLAYAVPVGMAIIAFHLIRSQAPPWTWLKIVGIMLAAIGLLGLFHSFGIPAEDAYQAALDGRGGGALGFMLSFPLRSALSPIAATLIFVTALLVGIFLTFNVSPAELWQYLAALIPHGAASASSTEEYTEEEEEVAEVSAHVPTFAVSPVRLKATPSDPGQLKLQEQAERAQRVREAAQLRAANRRYQPPDLNLLHPSIGQPNSGNVEENKRTIQSTLENFGIAVKMGRVNIGPTVTQYTLQPQEGIKLARITALQNDLALKLAAHPIRIEAPIPNTSSVGIEIPNKDVSVVRLRDLIAAKEFIRHPSPLAFVLGKDVAGRVQVNTLERMPHLLITGATGSGKSIFINTLIVSLLYRNSPSLVRFILVDPKRVELSVYNNIPHLLTPVIVEGDKTINALRWAVREMDRRYRLLSESGARNLLSFNTNNPSEAIPMIVIIIDELADLMARNAREVEGAIVRLSQMARAVGIHLVLATQRPSVNVITGLIKANIPSRVAFNVASQVDSRTILDAAGAEKLLGNGDMLFLPGDRAKPIRLQAGFVSEDEVRRVVQDIQAKNPNELADHDDSITSRAAEGEMGMPGEGGEDDFFEEAKRVVMESGKASASLLQRRLRVGYARAARLLDMLEERQVIGPGEGNKPREVLIAANESPLAAEDETRPHKEEQW